jgi:hypothetical protein
MSTIVISILIIAAVLILGFSLWSFFKGGWKILHQKIIGISIFAYGCYLATLTGSATVLVLPGVGAIGGGALVGAGAGWLTWAIIGTVGVATGGAGIALGSLGMALIGLTFGAVGGAVGGFGLKTTSYPLVNPIFWVPLLILGIYFCVGLRRKRLYKLEQRQALIEMRSCD